MPLFQKSVLRKHLNEQDKKKVAEAYATFTAHFGSTAIQQNIRDAKEEEYQEGFVRDLFVQVLGYTLKPQPDYNFVLEKKNEKDSKKADGAVVKGEAVHAVVELKGTDTVDLDHVEAQAFGYKNNQKGCRYVVVSNFEKLRFYIDDSVEHLEWDLFTLSADDFAVLYLCLQHDNLLGNIPSAIKEASVNEEKDVTKKLYNDYSSFKRQLYLNICALNPQHDKLTVYKKTQKLLDRFLFILFAEDKQLLPPNSIREILKQWQQLKDLDEHVPLYSRYQKYFGYMNTGHKGKQHDIFAYNGGLFAPDEVLDNIQVDDQLLYDSTFALSQYDFETDVDVNILGHIFEHSLNDVDAVTAETEGKQVEKDKTRRKKDGVFYTPKYITKYIVENTVGKLCEEKKAALEIKDEDYSGGKKKKDKKALNEKLETYRQWLLQLTILDPACGSGAFLNQALEFLIAEHRKVDELRSKLFGDSIVLTDVENHILENNLFGVDLNEESVEIAKLSLWLRTAKKGRKLSSLNSNIKCGNSLIDEPAVAGDKAFKWEEEFKEVFAKGGFDVVVGNPPYGAQLTKEEKNFADLKFSTVQYNYDTYTFFFETSLVMLKQNGYLGFITPNTFLVLENGDKLRRFLFEQHSIVNLFEIYNVFADAVVEPVISIIRKEKPDSKHSFNVLLAERESRGAIAEANVKTIAFTQLDLIKNQNLIFNYKATKEKRAIIDRVLVFTEPLVKYAQVTTGIKPYQVGKGTPPQSREIVDTKPYTAFSALDDTWQKLIRGTQVNRYLLFWDGEYIKYGNWLAEPRTADKFAKRKLLIRRTDDKLMTVYDEMGIVGVNSIHTIQATSDLITDKTLMCLLNSKLLNWIFQFQNFHMVGKPLAEVKVIFIERLPIAIPTALNLYENKADKMLSLNKDLQTVQFQFLTLLQSKFEIGKVSGKLEAWYELEFKDFLKELTKAKVKMSLQQEAEWLPYFTEQKKKAMDLKNEIEKTDKEIDKMVYALYELTPEEIEIVEGR